MVSVEGTIVERVYVGHDDAGDRRARAGRAPRGARAEHRPPRSDDRWEIGDRVTLGWHPEHALVLR